VDKRFIKFMHWLGTNHVYIRLSLTPCAEGQAVMKLKAADPNGNEALTSANNSFLQLVMKRLWASQPPKEVIEDDPEERSQEDEAVILSDMASMIDYMKTAGDTLPPAIKAWAYRNIAMTKSGTISQEEQRHAQRALSMMLRIQWQSSFFPSIDPVRARQILDEELYGMNEVKQRVIETIIQINRTHTLPGYGLLLVGPAGTGKSQIAYAVARILGLPWTSLDMSTIHDAEALTGSPRVYTNAKPGRIMEAFAEARSSNLVFIINELDKADAGSTLSNPADTLLTLLDGLGFTDNYIECTIPTSGVYPIATANDLSRISDPLLTRFALIQIPDYTAEERKIIFRDYSLPRVFKKMGMKEGECVITDDGIDAVVERYIDQPGVRSLEQAAEHIAANTLYQIETQHVASVTFDRSMVRRLLG
jgi:ATP-dependent Lon protease